MTVVLNRYNQQERLKNLGGSAIAVNTTSALIDQSVGNVNTTLNRRKSLWGNRPDTVNSPRINIFSSRALQTPITNAVIEKISLVWGYTLSYIDLRNLVNLIDRKKSFENRQLLLKELRLQYGNFLTASMLSKTISILRGSGILEMTRAGMEGPAVFGRSTFGTFILGDAHVTADYDIVEQLPGISPIQAREILKKADTKLNANVKSYSRV